MGEKKYQVSVDGDVVAKYLELNIATVLMKALFEYYCNENPNISVREMSEVCAEETSCKCADSEVCVKLGDEVYEVGYCVYREKEIHKNVTVIVSECEACGNIDIAWKRQPNTEDVIM